MTILKIMNKDRSKVLIPCYKDMDAYELPEEFAHLQAQDMSKIGFISLGCSKNLVDTEIMIGICKESGFEIVNDPALADAIVINTCGFIDAAKEEAIDSILEIASLKTEGKLQKLVVTGCLAQRYKEEIIKELPEVDLVVGVDEFPKIAELLESATGTRVSSNTAPYPEGCPRVLTTPSYMAYLKISEGCDNHCTYCAIPAIRGPYRSRKMEDVLKEAKWLYKSGVKELSVIAQDTTRYGEDLEGHSTLPILLEKLSEIGFSWIRLFYTYADRIDDRLLDVMANCKNIVPYLDIPIQHIDNAVLKRMGRRDTKESILSLVGKIKDRLPNVTLRTSLIVGFPGETEEAFRALCEFVESGAFDRVGVFRYSPEDGTPAAKLSPQIDDEIKAERFETLMSIAKSVSEKACRAKIGTVQTVLTEGFADMFYVGRTMSDGADIDGKVYFTSEEEIAPGTFVNVRILNAEEYDIIGEIEK